CISLRVVSKVVKRNSPEASSCTQATLLYLPRSMARMVAVDAAGDPVFVVVFMLASSSWGWWGLSRGNFRLPRPHGLHGFCRRLKGIVWPYDWRAGWRSLWRPTGIPWAPRARGVGSPSEGSREWLRNSLSASIPSRASTLD